MTIRSRDEGLFGMSNPLARLQPVLDLLTERAEVLPAYGQALVELATPSPEETYDREINRDLRIQGIWETAPGGRYRRTPPLHRRESHPLRFFGRGSTRVFFLATLLERERSSPVQIAQIGAAILERRDDGGMTVRREGVASRIALVLDLKELSDELRSAIEAAMPDGYFLWNSGVESSSSEQRLRGARVANLQMRRLSLSVVKTLGGEPDTWLVLGQSLGTEFTNWHGRPLIGVNHQFRQDHLLGVRREERSLFQLLAELPNENRTGVFPGGGQDHRGEIVNWYVRIRETRGLENSIAGVIRVDLPNPGGQKVETDLVDHLSRHLVAERTVAPYGSGPGWHARLYPLYLAEKVVRGGFHSPEVVNASLRWYRSLPSPVLAAKG